MNNYSDLTINEVLKLAQGDLDDVQLANRIVRRLQLDIRVRLCTAIADDREELANLTEVINNDLARRPALPAVAAEHAIR